MYRKILTNTDSVKCNLWKVSPSFDNYQQKFGALSHFTVKFQAILVILTFM